MSIVSLVIAPTLAQMSGHTANAVEGNKIEMTVTSDSSDDNKLITALKEDGLVQNGNYTIELSGDSLLINNILQPVEILEKYRTLVESNQKLRIVSENVLK
jgi:hypothetical protein